MVYLLDICQKNDNKNFLNEVIKPMFRNGIFDKISKAYIESLRKVKKIIHKNM